MTDTTIVRPRRAGKSRRSIHTTTTVTVDDARQMLRDFATFLAQQNPVALAAVATDVPGTIAKVAKIELWFRQYAAEIKKRRVQ